MIQHKNIFSIISRAQVVVALLMIAVGLLLSCSTIDDDAAQCSVNIPTAIKMTATSGDATATVQGKRAADGLYTSSTGFEGGESVMLFLYNSAYPDVIVSGTYRVEEPDASHKSELTYEGLTESEEEDDGDDEEDDVALTNPYGTELQYPVDPANDGTGESKFTLFGVYPSGSVVEHIVSDNQTAAWGYTDSDLMYAKTDVTWTASGATDKEHSVHNLQFNHQLAKLKLTVVKHESISQVLAVRMLNVKRKVSVHPTKDGIGLGEAEETDPEDEDYEQSVVNEILMAYSEEASDDEQTYTYCCVFPPQSWAEADFIAIDTDGGTAIFKLTKTFESGKEYSLTLDLTVKDLNLTATIANWKEGDDLGEHEFNNY